MKTEAQVREAIEALKKSSIAPFLTKNMKKDIVKSIALLQWVIE